MVENGTAVEWPWLLIYGGNVSSIEINQPTDQPNLVWPTHDSDRLYELWYKHGNINFYVYVAGAYVSREKYNW